MPTLSADPTATAPDAPVVYAFKASLIGAAHQFELTDEGLAWRVFRRSGVWPYADIAAVSLSYRPVSMQARRFRADLRHVGGARLVILSTSWQTAALMAPQDQPYRFFITELHARMARAGSKAILTAGLGRTAYAAGMTFVTIATALTAVLLLRALIVGQFAGAAFLLGFGALFGWQVGGFIRRNRPTSYGFDRIPEGLLP
jgi:hypothetical protein